MEDVRRNFLISIAIICLSMVLALSVFLYNRIAGSNNPRCLQQAQTLIESRETASGRTISISFNACSFQDDNPSVLLALLLLVAGIFMMLAASFWYFVLIFDDDVGGGTRMFGMLSGLGRALVPLMRMDVFWPMLLVSGVGFCFAVLAIVILR